MCGATVQNGEGGIDANLEMPSPLASGILRVEARDAHYDLGRRGQFKRILPLEVKGVGALGTNLDPVEDIHVLPAAIWM